ncbi:carcinoembryonic antigen-related cell adhesion molecule 8-like [Cebidichthys violaceus]|uniref:carcinoembryonic antigen-related cell adhesion molecule 8-like n=1 Tax=Cebidichthys violaceus TaxID=271503 RepID=UPI0035CC8794
MEIAVIHFIILVAISGLTKGAGVLPDSHLNKAVGETVMFSTTLTPSETPFQSVTWKFGGKDIIYFNVNNFTEPEYEGRITFFISTGSLELRNLTRDDSGEYSVSIAKAGEKPKEGNTRLDVHERISGASITSKTNPLIEGNSFNLSCDAAGSVFTRDWMKDGLYLTPDDNMALYDNNRVLSFNSLSKKDTGDYFCNVSNPLSHDDATYTMVVFYGPENVQICGPSEIHLKETLTLICFAESVPATYTWKLNGTKIHNSAIFTKNITESSDSGDYICEVMNSITGRTLSAVHGLSVTGKGWSGGLSAGAIAGIVIVCLVASSAGAGGGYYLYKKKNKKTLPPSESKEPEECVFENTSTIYENK